MIVSYLREKINHFQEVFMITVREACSVLTDALGLSICWDGNATPFDPDNEMFMDAFGNYAVKAITPGVEGNTFKIVVAARPIKAGEVK